MAKKENCNLQEDGVWNTIQYSKVPLEAAFSRGAGLTLFMCERTSRVIISFDRTQT